MIRDEKFLHLSKWGKACDLIPETSAATVSGVTARAPQGPGPFDKHQSYNSKKINLEAPLIWHLGFNGTEEIQVMRLLYKTAVSDFFFFEFSRHQLSKWKLFLNAVNKSSDNRKFSDFEYNNDFLRFWMILSFRASIRYL
ncbi:unnamed protein product [Onchocerca flexuosa]|uniref:Uncharacterized protein n=1 Tax=Onchocerca flexuosa TaxID=387005 RepID=A0A183I8F6_9BILA|nr:unnamed protein product [Onchocerca flexuosa]